MKTKILIAITAFVALGVLATGIVLAHNPYVPTPFYHNDRQAPDTGYYYEGCYGYDRYYRYPPPTPEPNTTEQPETPSTPEQPTQPDYYYPPQSPDQDYYTRGYGRGCWGW
ncbi:MAG: hypothetical protein PVI43_05015 [Candidatus Bathyarchaeota archaeon]